MSDIGALSTIYTLTWSVEEKVTDIQWSNFILIDRGDPLGWGSLFPSLGFVTVSGSLSLIPSTNVDFVLEERNGPIKPPKRGFIWDPYRNDVRTYRWGLKVW